jgi:hypothetical protein
MTTINLTPRQTTVLATAQTSIAHNGESIGIDQPFHREKMIMPDGRIHEVPTITGNSMRGILRDELANFTCEVLGITELPQAQFYLLYSGGSLVKDDAKGWTGQTSVSELRTLLPHLSLLGFSIGNHIAQGKVRIGKFIPLAKETSYYVPPTMKPLCNRSFYDMMQIEAYTRMDDSKRQTYAGIVKQGDVYVEDAPIEASQQMRFQIETICAGAQFWWNYSFRLASPIEQGAFYCALGRWANDPRIGGVGRWGHGLLELDFGGVLLNNTTNPFEQYVDEYADYLLSVKDRLLEILTYGL